MSTSLSTVQRESLAPVVMSDATVSVPASSRISDYAELCKPRILTMALIAMAVAGVAAASGSPNWLTLFNALIGTSLVAASSSIINQVFERTADRAMPRTQNRPIAAGRIKPGDATWVAIALLIAGATFLYGTTNMAVTSCALLTWALYACVYTPLKQLTVLNTAVGAVPGALPILIGWTAASGGTVDARGLWLFSILFVWQFPHFMAIAWIYKSQYSDAGFRMMSHNDATGQRSGVTAVIGSAVLLGIVCLQPIVGMGSILAVVPATMLAIGQLGYSFAFLQNTNDHTARRLLRASLIFLPAHLIIVTLSQFGIF